MVNRKTVMKRYIVTVAFLLVIQFILQRNECLASKKAPFLKEKSITLYTDSDIYVPNIVNLAKKADLWCFSSDTKVAIVSTKKAYIKCLSTGSANITIEVTQNKKKYKLKLKLKVIKPYIKVESEEENLEVGREYTYNAKVYGGKKEVTWESDDPAIAVIDERTGKVTPKSPGFVSFTVRTASAEYTLYANVYDKITLEISGESHAYIGDNLYYEIQTNLRDDDFDIEWKMSDPSMLQTDMYREVEATAQKPGTLVLTAVTQYGTVEKTIVVEERYIEGEKYIAKEDDEIYTLYPDDPYLSFDKVHWTISDESVAEVSEGESADETWLYLTTKKEGSFILTVEYVINGFSYTASEVITVG